MEFTMKGFIKLFGAIRSIALISLVAVIVLLMVECKLDDDGFKPAYKVGDTGPGGGIIFYVSTEGFTVQGYSGGFSTYTAHYLGAAPIGAGRINTALIIADPNHNSDNAGNNAAKARFG
jgi:hypothetical protein